MMIWVLRAMRADKSVGRPIASSKELVCRDWVPPSAAVMASRVVRMTLLYGSCWVRLHPDVWQWVRSMEDLAFFGLNWLINRYQRNLAARSMAISMKKFMPMPKKKESLGAKVSTSIPLFNAA